MKYTLITSMVLATVPAVAQQAAPAPTLVAGSEVKIESVKAAKWVQGEAPQSFEPGKVYMFECWATWCGPCVRAIPHVNELHKKFHDKGLRVYGMNVWEDGFEKVEKFVKAKGEGMSYPVAYTGKGSAFETEWLKPAGVSGIPAALIVKDGKLLLRTHPSRVTDALVEALIAGGEASQKAIDAIAGGGQKAVDKTMPLFRAFSAASQARDVAAMEKALAEIEKADPKSMQLPVFKIDILVVKKEFAAAAKAIEEIQEPRQKQLAFSRMASRIAMDKEPDAYSADFVKAILSNHEKMPNLQSPMGLVTLSILQWKSGDKDAALKSAKSAATATQQPNARKMPAAPFEKFVKAVEEGTLPTLGEFYQWMAVEMKPAQPADPVAPVTPTAPSKPVAE